MFVSSYLVSNPCACVRVPAPAQPSRWCAIDALTSSARARDRLPRHATKYSGQCMAPATVGRKGHDDVSEGSGSRSVEMRRASAASALRPQARFVALREPTLGASAHHPSRCRPCCGEPCRGVRSARHVVHSEQDTAETAVRPTSSARDGSAGHRSVSAPSVSNGGAEPHSSCVLLEYAGTAQPSRVGESFIGRA